MAVSSGAYRHRIKIYKDSGERDEYGGLIESRVLISNPWCRVKVLADNEIVGTQTQSQPMTEFEIRWSKTLETTLDNPTANMFLVFKNKEFDITSVLNHLELNEKLKITAIKR